MGTIRKMIRSGSLVVVKLYPSTKVGYRIRRAEVESILLERKRDAKKQPDRVCSCKANVLAIIIAAKLPTTNFNTTGFLRPYIQFPD